MSFFGIDCRGSYKNDSRQIDGAIDISGTTYLIELKFTKMPVGSPPLDTFKQKVESSADNTMGIFVSIAGFNEDAIKNASGKRTMLLLMDSSHLMMALNGLMDFSGIVERIRRHASQTGNSYLPACNF